MIISSKFAPGTTVATGVGSTPTPSKISPYMSATRRGVSTTPSRSGSSPISRIMRTAASTFARSISAIRRSPGRRASRGASTGSSSAARGRSELSRRRLIQTARSPSFPWAGAMSWNSDAATCTCRSRSAPARSKNRSQCPCAGLYELASAAVDLEIHGDADGLQRGGEELGVRVRQDADPPAARLEIGQRRGNLVERRPGRQGVAERLAVVVGELEPRPSDSASTCR